MVGVYSRDRRVEIREGDAFLGGAVFTADLAQGSCTVSARRHSQLMPTPTGPDVR